LSVFLTNISFAAGFVRALEIFAVCFGLRLAFGQYPYVELSLSLGVIPCLLAGRLADICQWFDYAHHWH
jgi:hypothetical protein